MNALTDQEQLDLSPIRAEGKFSGAPKMLVQFMRYGVIGGLAFVVDFTALLGLTELAHFHYLVAATVGFLLGLLVNYELATRWVFDYRRISSRRVEFLLFGVVGLVGLVLNNLGLYIMAGVFGLDYRIAKLITAALVLVFNFSVRRVLLFTPEAAALVTNAEPIQFTPHTHSR